jgi:hypothetical protein
MAEAIGYGLSQWQELNVFCSDGAVAIDNNASEREMKRVVLNRKNSLFVGNPRGGRTATILASQTSTCRRHDVDPQLYFTQLLVNLPTIKPSQFPAWLPDQWKLSQSLYEPIRRMHRSRSLGRQLSPELPNVPTRSSRLPLCKDDEVRTLPCRKSVHCSKRLKYANRCLSQPILNRGSSISRLR